MHELLLTENDPCAQVQQDNAKSGHSATAGQQCHMYCRTLPASSLTVQRQPLKLSIREALLSSSIGFRHLSGTSAESMSEGEYHHIADHLLDELHEKLEVRSCCRENPAAPDFVLVDEWATVHNAFQSLEMQHISQQGWLLVPVPTHCTISACAQPPYAGLCCGSGSRRL
jgi:hypothetical protein